MTWKKKKAAPDGAQPQAETAGQAEGSLSKYKKHLKWAIPLAVVLVVVIAAAASRAGQAKTVEAAPEYVQASVTRRTIAQTLSTTGTLKAANSYTVRTLVQGEILSSDFEEGDSVVAGQQLYQIENSDATTNVEQAQINLEQAQRNYDKIADYRYVRSPVAGTVYSLSVKVGDEVSSGQEIAVVQDASQMVLQLTFPSADAAHFRPGQTAQITLDGTFEVLTGTVTEVSGSDVLSTGNVLVRSVTIVTPNAGTLNTTQSATATINGISSTNSATFNYQDQRTLTASTAGTVASIYIPEGGHVAEDGVVIELAGEDLEETIQNAYESLRSREISMRNAEETLANYTISPHQRHRHPEGLPGRRDGGERQGYVHHLRHELPRDDHQHRRAGHQPDHGGAGRHRHRRLGGRQLPGRGDPCVDGGRHHRRHHHLPRHRPGG